MKFSFSNVNEGRNLSNHIKQSVHLSFAEVCPLEETHAEIHRRRIKREEHSIEFKRLVIFLL